jgi:tetratricopeptide (TPR) repeat protein
MPRRSRPGAAAGTIAACRAAASTGDIAKALTLALTAVKLEPTSYEALFLTAAQYHRLGRLDDAIAFYTRAIRVNAAVPDAHHNVGVAHLAQGRIREGAASLVRAIELRPDYPEALDALGYATAQLGAYDEARAFLERAIALHDAPGAVYGRLGQVLLRLQRYDEALARFTTAIERDPRNAELHDGLGVALARLDRTEDSIAAHQRALVLDPHLAHAAANLGHMLIERGDIDDAMTWFDRAIELEPRNGSFYLPLATGGAKRIAPQHIAAMKALASEVDTLPRAQQIDLHFALGNVYEREGRVDGAFRHLAAGNALKRADIAYDEPAALAYVRSVEAAFSNPIMESLRGCGDPSDRPIFVLGMPRSGSTLVEQLLAAHPAVASAGEIDVLGPIVREMWPAMNATSLDGLRAQVRTIGERYLRGTDALAGAQTHLTDKTLEHVQLVPLIHVTLPNARIIHIQRDDLDTCFSCFATFFADQKVPFSYDLGELGRYYRGYLRMMERWRPFVPPDRMLEVRYEDLVDDFETHARRIIAFCGLPWDPACLAFHQVRRPVRTASNVQVRQPLYRNALRRAQPFLSHLAPLIEALRPAD